MQVTVLAKHYLLLFLYFTCMFTVSSVVGLLINNNTNNNNTKNINAKNNNTKNNNKEVIIIIKITTIMIMIIVIKSINNYNILLMTLLCQINNIFY